MKQNNDGKIIIAVDAMGGDFAPQNTVLGAVEAGEADSNIQVLLVGQKSKIIKVLDETQKQFDRENIINAEQIVEMNDSPSSILKEKPDSSMSVGAKLVKDGKAHAFVSAGNTGAMMAICTLILGRLPGVSRPTIGSFMPNQKGVTTIFDVGANVDSKPQFLFEYAVMGSIFVKEIYGVAKPSVGLLSVGEEEEKGTQASKAAYEMLKKSNLNFIGNIEGGDVLKGTANVVVCDGFIGNIILKFAESVIGLLRKKAEQFARKSFLNKIRVLTMKGTLKKILKEFDYQVYGGVPLLGVKGVCIIGHGSSSPLAIKNMICRAKEMFEKNIVNKIETSLKQN